MLKIRMDFNNERSARMGLNNEILHFTCPSCGTNDLLYTSMPRICWNCGKAYLFNVKDLITNLHARYQYYKHKRIDKEV